MAVNRITTKNLPDASSSAMAMISTFGDVVRLFCMSMLHFAAATITSCSASLQVEKSPILPGRPPYKAAQQNLTPEEKLSAQPAQQFRPGKCRRATPEQCSEC